MWEMTLVAIAILVVGCAKTPPRMLSVTPSATMIMPASPTALPSATVTVAANTPTVQPSPSATRVLNPFPPGTAESRAWDLFQELLWTRDVEMRAARGTGLTDNEQAALWLEIQKLCGVWSVLPTPQIKKE